MDHFSDQLITNQKVVEANPELNEWHTKTYPGRLPGLKFLRTLWVAALAGGPFQYTARALRDAHFDLKILPDVFDEVQAELGRTLDHFEVPEREKGEASSVVMSSLSRSAFAISSSFAWDVLANGRQPARRDRDGASLVEPLQG